MDEVLELEHDVIKNLEVFFDIESGVATLKKMAPNDSTTQALALSRSFIHLMVNVAGNAVKNTKDLEYIELMKLLLTELEKFNSNMTIALLKVK